MSHKHNHQRQTVSANSILYLVAGILLLIFWKEILCICFIGAAGYVIWRFRYPLQIILVKIWKQISSLTEKLWK